MKRIFLILTFFLCGLCCFGQTTITEEYFNKIDGAYQNAEWEKVLQYCDSIDYYKIDGLPYALLKAEALAGLGRLDEAINYLNRTIGKCINRSNDNLFTITADRLNHITNNL